MPTEPAVLRVLGRHSEVVYRERERTIDETRFRNLQERIRNGLEWGVGAVVTNGDGEVLLVRQRDRWSIPGGGVEPGETLEEALTREVHEETGVDVSVGALRVVTEQTIVHGDDEEQFYFATYTATPTTTETADDPGVSGEPIEAVDWVRTLPRDTLDRDLVVELR